MEGIHEDPNPAPGGAGGGDDGDYEAVEKALKEGKKIRQTWEAMWEEIYDFVFPNRQGFTEAGIHVVEGEQRGQVIFDDTAMMENPRFVSRIVNGMFPQGSRAFRLKPHPNVVDRGGKLQSELDAVTDVLHEGLRNSNFHNEIHEAITDLSISTMTMMVSPGPFSGDLRFTAIPMVQVYILPGPFGGPDSWIRQRKVKISNIKRIWKKAKLNGQMQNMLKSDPEKEVITVEFTTRIRDRTSEEKYITRVACSDFKHVFFKEKLNGAGSNPYITTRWTADAGETYGRGPLIQILPTIKTLNLVMEMILEAGQWALGGAYTYDDDGVFNFENVTLEPGVFIPRAPGSKIDALQSSTSFDIGDYIIADQRNNIRRALFSAAPDRPQGKTPPSVMEIAEDRAESARNQGSAVARIQYEFMIPLVNRLIYIYRKFGYEFPLVDGKSIVMVPESPLVRSQDQQDIADLMRYGEALQFLFGPEAAVGAQQPHEAIPWLAERFRINGKLVPTADEIQNRMQAAAQAIQQGVVPGA